MEGFDSEKVTKPINHEENFSPKPKTSDVSNEVVKSACASAHKRKKVVSKIEGRKYPLRSSLSCGRVLRSMTNEKCKSQPVPVATPVNPVTKGRKKRRTVKRTSSDEFALIRKRVRYSLNRINYEQSLLEAYSGEGWKGQSAEKIRPEMELERAKREILRRKHKIRELFRHLDSLSLEGRFEESLFDSEGEIDSEDIFCAKCHLTDVSADNDIILCDGMCDRGFHQKCLNPPLLSEEIPLGDEGWLCPACDCKVDCIELLTEIQGSDISIEDQWEKVFPEAASVENGDNQQDDLPSDDSEDGDYEPDGPEVSAEDQKEEPNSEESDSDDSDSEESDSEESDSISEAEDLNASNCNKQNENTGLPSDDSEDEDFDPDGPDLDESSPKDGSSADDSDFTSDSDEFCKELSKSAAANEDSASSLQKSKPIVQSGEGTFAGDIFNSELLSALESGLNQEDLPISAKRQLEKLDYKKLHDQEYGKSTSDSSDDEDWSESADMSTPNKVRKYDKRKESGGLSTGASRATRNRKTSNTSAIKSKEVDAVMKPDSDHSQVPRVGHENSSSGKHQAMGSSAMEHEVAKRDHGQLQLESSGNKPSGSGNRMLNPITRQKLHESFQENQYPTREKKQNLAQELGVTYQQVDKWFVNARHSFRVKVAHANGVVSPRTLGESSANSKHPAASITPDTRVDEGHLNEGIKRENSTKTNESVVDHSTPSKGVKRKNSTPGGQSNSHDERDNKDASGENKVDKDRQKAIARELRKVKQGR